MDFFTRWKEAGYSSNSFKSISKQLYPRFLNDNSGVDLSSFFVIGIIYNLAWAD